MLRPAPAAPIAASLLARAGLTGCAGVVVARTGPGHPAPGPPAHAPGRAARDLGIPRRHLPPPGERRIWNPGRPPCHQPAPGDGPRLSREVPDGAWLLHPPAHRPREVKVSVYDPDRPRVVIEVRCHDAATGRFLRFEAGG